MTGQWFLFREFGGAQHNVEIFFHIIVVKFSGLMSELISVSQFEVSGIAGKTETCGWVDMTRTI